MNRFRSHLRPTLVTIHSTYSTSTVKFCDHLTHRGQPVCGYCFPSSLTGLNNQLLMSHPWNPFSLVLICILCQCTPSVSVFLLALYRFPPSEVVNQSREQSSTSLALRLLKNHVTDNRRFPHRADDYPPLSPPSVSGGMELTFGNPLAHSS